MTQAYVGQEAPFVNRTSNGETREKVVIDSPSTQRYFELDALRVIAFGVLIFYHIGMYYVLEWGWHIKSDVQFPLLQDVMILTNQWRMSLLFLISAMVFTVVLRRAYDNPKSRWRESFLLLWQRALRILIPLLFGMFVIVAPQVYVEWTASGALTMPFSEFYIAYINPNTGLFIDKQSVIGLLTWNHLWFLPYLFVYSAIILLLFPLIRFVEVKELRVLDSLAVFSILAVFIMTAIWLELRAVYPTSHDLLNDWYSHAKYFFVMLVGIVVMLRPALYAEIMNRRYVSLTIAILLYSVIILDRHNMLGPTGELMASSRGFRILVGVIVVLNHWAWLAAILGFGRKYLSSPSRVVNYLNKGILPYYIVHQTIIVMAAFYLSSRVSSTLWEFISISLLTVAGCALTYEIAKRFLVLRFLFGLRLHENKK
ncbi:acyltransferase family protein [Alteromonas gracilis]|uniref:acyltransferase family protein n=1 Tax=Alteromonas gracilis TaxID=1479524 RepID=UPI003734D8A9